MNIKLLAIGKTDNKSLQSLIDEYTKRLSFYIKFDLEIIPDIKNVKNLSEAQQKKKKANWFYRNFRLPTNWFYWMKTAAAFRVLDFRTIYKRKWMPESKR